MSAGRASENQHGYQNGAGRTETEIFLLILLQRDFLFLHIEILGKLGMLLYSFRF